MINVINISQNNLELAQFDISNKSPKKVSSFNFNIDLMADTSEKIAERLIKRCKEHNINKKNPLIATISRYFCTTRYAQSDYARSSEIEHIIKSKKFELYAEDLDKLIIRPVKVTSSSKDSLKFVFFAVPGKIIRKYISLLNIAYFSPEILTVSSIVLFNQFQQEYLSSHHKKNNLLVLHLRKNQSELFAVHKEDFILSYDLESDFSRGFSNQSLINEVNKWLKIYKKDTKQSIDKIVLSAEEELVDLQRMLKSSLDLDVERIKPLDLQKATALTYTSNFPYKVNLLPDDIQSKQLSKKKNKKRLATIGLIIVFLVLSYINFLMHIKQKHQLLTNIKSQLRQYQAQTSKLNRKIAIIKKSEDIKKSTLDLLDSLTTLQKSSPEGLALSQIFFEASDSFSLKGQTYNSNDIYTFVENLKLAPCFSEVKLDYARRKSTELNSRDIVEFKITGRFSRKGIKEE